LTRSIRIRVGPVTLACLPPKEASVCAETDAAPYLNAIEHLGRMLAPDTWALAGGLVIPISVGGFYRRHTDIDIVMPLARLCDVVDAFRAGGYELYTNWSVSHHSRGILLQCRVRSDGGLVKMRPRRLYVKRREPAMDEPLLEKIDLYPYRERDRGLETCNTRRVLSRRTMQRSALAPFGRPGDVQCLHLDNVASLKSLRSGTKHRLDCMVIRDGPDAARDWFRRHAPPALPPALVHSAAGPDR